MKLNILFAYLEVFNEYSKQNFKYFFSKELIEVVRML